MEMKSSWTKDVQAKLLKETIATLRDEVLALNDWMAEHPELGSQEFESSRRIVELLRSHGLEVEYPFGGLQTAFKATVNGGKNRKKRR